MTSCQVNKLFVYVSLSLFLFPPPLLLLFPSCPPSLFVGSLHNLLSLFHSIWSIILPFASLLLFVCVCVGGVVFSSSESFWFFFLFSNYISILYCRLLELPYFSNGLGWFTRVLVWALLLGLQNTVCFPDDFLQKGWWGRVCWSFNFKIYFFCIARSWIFFSHFFSMFTVQFPESASPFLLFYSLPNLF